MLFRKRQDVVECDCLENQCLGGCFAEKTAEMEQRELIQILHAPFRPHIDLIPKSYRCENLHVAKFPESCPPANCHRVWLPTTIAAPEQAN